MEINQISGISAPPLSTSSPKASADGSLNVTDAGSVTSRGSRRIDVSKITRLLDHLNYDDDGLCEYDDIDSYNTDDVCFFPVNEASQAGLEKGRLTEFHVLYNK